MNMVRCIGIVGLWACAAFVSGAEAYLFEDVYLVPMDREVVLERRSVLVRGDRIEAIGIKKCRQSNF